MWYSYMMIFLLNKRKNNITNTMLRIKIYKIFVINIYME